jgi:hypothetical protein
VTALADPGPAALDIPKLVRTARRAGRIIAIAVVGVFAAYLTGMNLFLRTGMFRDAITSSSGSLLVQYRSAYSLLPGRIHVEGLVIRGRDSSVEWILLLDRCDFRVSFLELARRRFHASHVTGDGLSLRIRLRKDAPPSEDEMRALPPVPGFLDPPLKDVGPPPPALTDAKYNLWSIRLDDVDANHVREIWIDTVRSAGDLEIRGRWFFRPLRWLDVGPATVRVRALDVGYGEVEPWFSGAAGELIATIHPFALQGVLGADILDEVSVDGSAHGTVRVTHLLRRVLEAADRASRADDAEVDARIRLDHGVWRPGTQVDVERFALDAHAGEIGVEGSFALQARVDGGGTGHLSLEASGGRAERCPSQGVRAGSIVANFTSRDLDLASLVDNGFDLPGRLEAQEVVARYEGTTVAAPRFSVAASATRFRPGPAGVSGALMVAADALSVERSHVTGTADFLARITFSQRRSPKEAVELSGSDVQLRNAHATVKGASVVIPSLEARARHLTLGGPRPAGQIALEVPDIELPLSLVPNALLLLPKGVSIDGGRGSAAISADVDLDRREATGVARVVAEGVRARVGQEAIDGQLRLELRATGGGGGTDLSGSTLAFDGTVGTPPVAWWARAALGDARLEVRSGLRLRAQVTANAKDASPLAAIVSNNTAIPRWLLDAISTSGLTAAGDLRVSPSTFQARSVRARAAGIDLGLELAELGAEREWALLLDVGVVCAGIDVSGDQTDVLLFGAKPWFAKKTASLRAVERRYE